VSTTIELVYFNAGGGHRAAAEALAAVLREQRPGWRVRLTDLVPVLDPQQRWRRITGFDPEELYNRRLARGWTLGLGPELKLLQRLIRFAHEPMVRVLARHWDATAPELVVSLIPNFNRALRESLALARPRVPYVTVMTDLADLPPHFWIEPGALQHLVCGTDRAVAQALAAGIAPTHVHRVSGMILRPDFYRPPRADRDAERRRLGLEGKAPVGLVLFGAHGSNAMLQIARLVPETPLVLIAGRHAKLAERLAALPARAPRIVLGYTRDVAGWMQLADFFIGKPGPGCLSEALQQKLPVIVTRNAWTMPQERYNTEWVREQGVGLVLTRWRELPAALASLPLVLPALRERVAAIENRALFELPALLDRLLAPGLGRGAPDASAERASTKSR
jgi:1,2-diacylglycerol 3-beta-galactosyltransferase